ncbi:MAG: tripartite tricarboxylate transporter substrate binding protein, partial [Alphaproteobacteria bacterium]|nr:tripartite tricarboxylate transporter substrate binding protein [Alphaproteobacteria bacterium]
MQRLIGALLALVALGVSSGAAAQAAWPNKPVKFIVPFSAGGSTDVLARHFGDKLTGVLGQPFVIDNRTGAGGIIGTDIGAKSPADGYTFLFSISSTLTVNPYIFKTLPYDPVKDIKPVLQL